MTNPCKKIPFLASCSFLASAEFSLFISPHLLDMEDEIAAGELKFVVKEALERNGTLNEV